MLLYPGANASRVRQRWHDALLGDSQRYSVDYSNKIWDLMLNFSPTSSASVDTHTLGRTTVLWSEGRLAGLKRINLKVPPELRFFAGGDRSIRGYKYQSISPEDNKGKLTGGIKNANGIC